MILISHYLPVQTITTITDQILVIFSESKEIQTKLHSIVVTLL